jgi:hypothetical protein
MPGRLTSASSTTWIFCVDWRVIGPDSSARRPWASTFRAAISTWGWDVELFCQVRNTDTQWGVRHFRVERRLLAIDPDLRSDVIERKRCGMKTEPAFAAVLGLTGDPYQALLDLERSSDTELTELLAERRR